MGGVGKNNVCSHRTDIADCENGTKYFGLRGIAADVALIEKMGRYAQGVYADRTRGNYDR